MLQRILRCDETWNNSANTCPREEKDIRILVGGCCKRTWTGRRTLEDTVNKWKENPAGMAYGAIDRSGLTGWLSRPLGMLELTPYGPGKLLKNQGLSSAYGRPGEWVDKFSPGTGWVNKVYSGTVGSLYDGGWNRKNQMLLWRAMPFNNLWAVEGFNRAAERMGFDTPIGPRFQYQGGR